METIKNQLDRINGYDPNTIQDQIEESATN